MPGGTLNGSARGRRGSAPEESRVPAGAKQVCISRAGLGKQCLQVEKPFQLSVGVEHESVGALGCDLRGLDLHVREQLRLNFVHVHADWTDR